MNILVVLYCFSCLVVGFFAFHFHKNEKNRLSIILLIILGLCLRVFAASDLYLHCWDERYHALVSKNLILNPLQPYLYRNALLTYDYTNWTSNHIWLHKQPLSLWIMMFSLKAFGINEYAVRLPSVLFSTISIWLVYVIAQYFSDKKVAFLAAFFFAINGLIIEICSGRVATDHPDTSFIFFTLLSIFFTVKFIEQKKIINILLLGVSLGVALLTKWLPALIVLPIWLILVWDEPKISRKQIFLLFMTIVCIAMLVFLPWQFYIHFQFPQESVWERNYNSKHFWKVLEGQGGDWYYYLNRIRIDYGELIYLPIIWVFYRFAKNIKQSKTLALIAWFSIPLIFFSLAATKMNGYLLIVSPALFIVTASFYYELKAFNVNTKLVLVKKLVLMLLIGLPIRYCIERLKPFDTNIRRPQWVVELKNWNQNNNSNAVLFGYNAPIEAMFYTNAIVYEIVPSVYNIKRLQQLGYHIYISNSANTSKEIRELKGVNFVSLKNPDFN